MRPDFLRSWGRFAGAAALCLAASNVAAEPRHGIAMYGDPALPPDFVSFPYVNPEAPKGGTFVFGEVGSWDSLNPFVLKGRSVDGQQVYGYETLLARSWDEPFTLYGWLAESVEVPPGRDWVEFTLRSEARFSDGTPVTVEDVLWSFETLGTAGHPRYHGAWDKVASAEAVGPRTVRFTFAVDDDELPLIMGLRPILKKAQFEGRDFAEISDEVPIGSGPYRVGDYEPGRFMELVKNPDWWAADLPAMRGQHNIGTLRYEYYGDGDVAFEAFRAGALSTNRESNMAKWQTAYDFPAVQRGDIVLSEIPHQRPSGIAGFVMNTRRAPFDDWRVRDALIHAFNFEFVNGAINGGTEPRIASYFSNSILGMEPGAPAEGAVRALLEPFADTLLPGALEGYALPVADGSEANRRNIRAAIRILGEAGYEVVEGVMTGPDGRPLEFEIVLSSGGTQITTIAELYAEQLKRIGVRATLVTIDGAQYKERTDAFDFDMAFYVRTLSLSPGNEQMLYWGGDSADTPGSRNWMGVKSPAIDAMIQALLTAPDQDGFVAAVKALDRVLTSGRYVVPIWHSPVARIAHRRELRFQRPVAMYGDYIGFQPDVWWIEPE